MKLSNIKSIISLLLCLLSSVCSLKAYNLKSVTSKDGLTNSAILSFGQLENGLMFIGTCDGVNCYDGTRIFPLPSTNGVSVKGNIIEDIVPDTDNRAWILTNHGLAITKRTEKPLNIPRFQSAQGIKMNSEGRLTVLQDSSIYYYAGHDTTFVRLPLRDGDLAEKALDFAMTSKNLYLFLTDGIVSYTLHHNGTDYDLGQRTVLSAEPWIMANSDGKSEMLIDAERQLWTFDLSTGQRYPLLSLRQDTEERGTVESVRTMGSRIFVCFASSGVLMFEHHGQQYEKHDLGLNVGILCSYKSPQDDIMWIGTDGRGVIMFIDEAETRRSLTTSVLRLLQNKPYRAIYKDIDGTLWAGTKGDGLLEIPHFNLNNINDNLGRFFHRREKSALTGNSVFALQPSKLLNGFWIATNGGLNFHSRRSGKIVTVTTELPLQWISAVCERGDTLWVTTQGMGVYRGIVTGTEENPHISNMRHYVLDNGKKTSNYFFSMASTPGGGNLYFGNRSKGLYYLQDDKLKYIKPDIENIDDPGLQDIFAILPASEGGVWVGTGSGLTYHHIAKNITEFYTTDNGLPGNVICALTEDQSGNVWASTNKGLVRILRGSHAMRIYNEIDNMEVNEYTDGAAFSVGDTVFFGGFNGISIIVSSTKSQTKSTLPRFAFTQLEILGNMVNINEFLTIDGDEQTLTLNYKQNTLKLGIATFDFKAPNNYIYYYSFSKNGPWINNGSNSEIALTRLIPENHTLYVRPQDRITGEELPIYTLHIHITPPWFFSWWAYLCYLLIAIGMAFVGIRWWIRSRERRQLIKETREEQERREELYEQKMHFLTNLVHELNTPLTLVYGPCERIQGYAGSDDFVRKYIRMIQANIGRLSYLIKEIIDFRRMSTTEEPLYIRAVAVGKWVEEIFKAFVDFAEDNSIVYENDIDNQLVWNIDEHMLPRICSNLISNAFKYSHRGSTIRVSLHISEDDNQLVFSVYNTGKGISEADRLRIFDYFTVLDNVDESSILGLTSRNGLGMAICHNAVTRLDGTISIDSKEDEYACFTVRLPWKDLPEGAEDTPLPPIYSIDTQDDSEQPNVNGTDKTQQPPVDEPVAEEQLDKRERKQHTPHAHRDGVPTVLVIDDNTEILELLEDTLSDNYNVLTAESGEQGLEVIKQLMPDIIITDIMMPGMDGLELTQQLKQNKHTMHIPLIILSARRSDTEQVKGLESGADAYVSKPFSTQYLQATLARLLENRKVLKEYFNTSASAYTYQEGKLMTGEERQFRDEVVAAISKNIKNADYTPDDLARDLTISQRNLYRKFNEAGLPTPKEYIKQFKIEFAARQLDTTNLTIQEIIYSSGFNTRSQFYTEFRKHYGITPKDYREQRRVRDESLE